MDANNDQHQDAEQIRFVQITQDILENKELNSNEKIILARISGFDHFFESNERTAEKLGLTPRIVRDAKQKLRRLDLIRVVANTGHGLVYEFAAGRWTQKRPSDGRKSVHLVDENPSTYKEREYKESNKEKKTSKEKNGSEPQQFGNPDVNALLDAWAEATGFDYKNSKMERYAMAGLIKQHGYEATESLVERVKRARRSGDRFAPQIAKPSQLRGKYSKLEALTMWEERSAKQAEAERKANPARIYPAGLPDYAKDDDSAPDTPEAKAERKRQAQEIRNRLFEKIGGAKNGRR